MGVASLMENTKERCDSQNQEESLMRVAVGGYLAVANSFATQRTGLEQFQHSQVSGDDLIKRMGRGDSAIAGFLHGAQEQGWNVAPRLSYSATHIGE
jgi:microcystin degradation protein MlrC